MTAAPRPRVFIDGEFRIATHAEPVLEAATGEPIGDGASGTGAEVDAAVAAARAALPQWRSASPDHRAGVLLAFAAALHRRADSTDKLVTRENGMPMLLSRGANGLFPAALLGYYAKLITETPIEQIRPGRASRRRSHFDAFAADRADVARNQMIARIEPCAAGPVSPCRQPVAHCLLGDGGCVERQAVTREGGFERGQRGARVDVNEQALAIELHVAHGRASSGGSSAPGLRMPSGSNARLTARATAMPPDPSSRSMRGAFERPTP